MPVARRRRSLPVIAAATLALAGATACSDTASRNGLSSEFSVSHALAALPAADGTAGTVSVGDLDRASQLAGARRPVAADDAATVGAWRQRIGRAGVVLPPSLILDRAGPLTRDRLGMDVRDVRWYAGNDAPPRGALAMATVDGTRLSPDLPKDGDLMLSGEGEPGSLSRDVDPTTGAPRVFLFTLALRQEGPFILAAQNADQARAWPDGPSLADDDAHAAVAAALDRHAPFAAVTAPPRPGGAPPARPRTGGPRATASPIGHDLVGVAEARRGTGPREVIAYHVADPEAARPVVERVWREGRSLLSGERLSTLARVNAITVEDGCVVVEVTPARPGIVMQMMQASDAPFAG